MRAVSTLQYSLDFNRTCSPSVCAITSVLSTLSFANCRLDLYNDVIAPVFLVPLKFAYGLGPPPPMRVLPLVSCGAALDKLPGH